MIKPKILDKKYHTQSGFLEINFRDDLMDYCTHIENELWFIKRQYDNLVEKYYKLLEKPTKRESDIYGWMRPKPSFFFDKRCECGNLIWRTHNDQLEYNGKLVMVCVECYKKAKRNETK